MDSRFSRLSVGLFEAGFRPWMALHIHAVRIAGIPAEMPTDGTIVVAANHVSWWDGFIARAVQRRLRPGGAMLSLMSDRELRRHPFLRLMGAVAIQAGSAGSLRSALRQLDSLARIEQAATLLIFPQGRIWPSSRRPLGFAPGVEFFARQLAAPVFPMGIHLEPLNRTAPTAFVSVGASLAPDTRVERIERAVEAELDRIRDFLELSGEDAPAAWPERGESLPGPRGRDVRSPLQ